MEWSYKCVAVPESINTGQSGKDSHSAAVTVYEQLINDAAKGGWELDHIDTVESRQSPGLCAKIIGMIPIIGPLCCGRKSEIQIFNYKIMVFKKAK